MEIFGAVLVGVGIIALIGAIFLLWVDGLLLSRAIETNTETLQAIAATRESTKKDFKNIENWILEINIGLEESNTKMQSVKDYVAQNLVGTDKRLRELEQTFKILRTGEPAKDSDVN